MSNSLRFQPPSRWARITPYLMSVLFLILVLASAIAWKAEAIRASAEGYIFGNPLVIVDLTRQASARNSTGPRPRP